MNPKNQINIFIVEDNIVFTLALKEGIENAFVSMPIKIHSFVTAETCMEKFKEEKPQVVIVNYHLNNKYSDGVDGIKVLDWVKKENYETHVIMLTNDDHINIALRSFQHGASDYIVKTETKFKKINYSLLNSFKMIDAKRDLRRYKHLAVGLFLCVALLIGGVIAIQLFDPSLFR